MFFCALTSNTNWMPSQSYSQQLLLRAMRTQYGYLGNMKPNSIRSKMNLIGSLLLVMVLASCGSSGSRNALNESALYDPDHVTLKEGVHYNFEEGILVGRLQKFHSQFSYQRAVIIGDK